MKIVKIIVIALAAVVIAADLCILHQESDKLKKLKRELKESDKLKKLKREHKKIVKEIQEFDEEVALCRAVAQNIKTQEIWVEPQEPLQEYVEDPVFHDVPTDMPTDGR